MKRFFFLLTALVAACVLFPIATPAQEGSAMKVAAAAICESVSELEPVNPGVSFAASLGKLYCFTKIVDVPAASEVVHVWYFGETERARVPLAVQPPGWRTYSSKIIQQHETGPWRVEVRDASANLLETVSFELTP